MGAYLVALLGTSENQTKVCIFTEKMLRAAIGRHSSRRFASSVPSFLKFKITTRAFRRRNTKSFWFHLDISYGTRDCALASVTIMRLRATSHCPNLEIDADFETDVYFDDMNADHLPAHLTEMTSEFADEGWN